MRFVTLSIAVAILALPEALPASFFKNPIKNITPDVYKGGTQVWQISKGRDDYVFFATGFEFTVWDGVMWESYPAGRGRYMRAVGYDRASGKVYCAGDNFYGYWSMNRFGDFELTVLYSNDNPLKGEIFRSAVPVVGGVYFQTRESIVWYDTTARTAETVIKDTTTGYVVDTGADIYAQCDGAVFRLDGASMTPEGIEIDDRIVWIDHAPDGGVLLICEKKGMLLFRDSKLSDLDAATNRFLEKMLVFSACPLPDGNYLLGTILNGAYIVDRRGRIRDTVNDSTGLDFTTVLSVAADDNRNIWLGLDGAIACIPENPLEKYYNSADTQIGNVYAPLLVGDRLYLGTNKGLFVVDGERDYVRLIENTQGQVWDIRLCGADIIVCRDKGLCRLTPDERLELLMPDVWRIDQWTGDEDIYYAADGKGLLIFEVSGGRFVFCNRVAGYSGYNNYAKVDKYGNMWISGSYGEMRRLALDRDKQSVESDRTYTLPQTHNRIEMSVLDGDVVFIADGECYSYDPYRDSIVLNEYYTNLASLFCSELIRIFQADDCFFNLGAGNISVVRRNTNEFTGPINVFRNAGRNGPPAGFRSIRRLNDSIVSYGFANGVAFCNINRKWFDEPDNVRLRKLEYSLLGNTALLDLSQSDSVLRLPNSAANMKLFFTGLSSSHRLNYSLDGSPWESAATEKPLTLDYLASGDHLLRLRSNASGSPERRFVISIGKHFTSKPAFFMLLAAVFALLCWFGWAVYDRRLEKLKARYRRQHDEALEKERINHENEMLSLELREREMQLAAFAINDVGINSMLDEIDSEIDEAVRSGSGLEPDLSQVRAAVRKYRRNNGHWKVLETYLNGVYDGFLRKLTARYPHLTNNDLKICALIKLGMSTKEMAAFLSIEVTSVESARYRLRKNMGLPQSESLSKLLNKI